MIQLTQSLRKVLVAAILVFSFIQTASAQDGKALFQNNCASCHRVDKDLTGPALQGLEGRGPWADKQKLYAWIHNPAGFMATDPYTQGLKAKYGVVMQAFPGLATKEIDAIVAYINTAAAAKPSDNTAGAVVDAAKAGDDNSLMFGILTVILGILALILLQVNSNLKKLTDEKEGVRSLEPVPFWKNKMYLFAVALICFVVGGYFLASAAIGLGRNKNYQPEQPIYYSHKVHAGINQINCLYCHGGAQIGKHANIPSINVCMNCHMAINEYAGKEKMYREDGTEVNGTAEIQKLYKYAGFDPAVSKQWEPSKASKPVEWIRIHNLPDHVYFNHAQHVVAGKQQCQTCHGPIQEMGEAKQFADLSMGWCINCHRETKVQFNDSKGNGNQFYSIYEKFHDDIRKGKYDSVTVEMIGGTECQKCHY